MWFGTGAGVSDSIQSRYPKLSTLGTIIIPSQQDITAYRPTIWQCDKDLILWDVTPSCSSLAQCGFFGACVLRPQGRIPSSRGWTLLRKQVDGKDETDKRAAMGVPEKVVLGAGEELLWSEQGVESLNVILLKSQGRLYHYSIQHLCARTHIGGVLYFPSILD